MRGGMDFEETNVVSVSLRRQVEDKLRRAIVKGRFPPGVHLADKTLCELFNVSRTVIREAVRQLEAEGLVKSVPHKGSFVKILSLEEARHIYSVRGVLEALAAREFVRNASDSKIDELAKELENLRSAASGPLDVVDQKEAFYEVLLSGSGNSYITMMLGQILNWTTQLRATSLSAPNRLEESIVELERLLEAIRNRDENAAWAASFQHVTNAAKVALAIMAEREGNESEPSEMKVRAGI